MKAKFTKLLAFAPKFNSQNLQVVLALLTLALFVLGAGAPEGGGGIIGPK
jgi:hypothetical protein